jgi:aldose 1-epimerase
MKTITIREGPLAAMIEPGLGAGLSGLVLEGSHGRADVLRAATGAARFTDLSMYLMAPWTNRIAGARFVFEGKEYRVRADWEDGSAIHGDVKTRAWRVLDRTPVSARLAYDWRDVGDSNWPWPYAAEVRYEIEDGSLRTDLGVQNLGDTPMPAGLGFHPFFKRRLWGEDDVRVKVVTNGRYPVKDIIPSGPARPDDVTAALSMGGALGTLALDDVFAGFQQPAVITWLTSGVEAIIESSVNLGHVVVFSPKAKAGMEPWFCVEPVSTVTDAFNLASRGQAGTGVTVVKPGEWMRATMTIRIRDL